MALSKQLLILISVLFLMIFSVNFVLSINSIKSYLEGEAEIHAQDTATSLGVSLSPYMVNETDPIIETTMNAIFDMGYYQEIKLVNLDNKSLVTLTNQKQVQDVPKWFINFISIKTATAKSEINSGWNISGVVKVTINPGYAYVQLYDQTKTSFYLALATFIFSIGLLSIVLRFTLSSLKKIDHMALTIAGGRFETIDELPWTSEVRNVTTSMNMMSKKIEKVINSLNSKLDDIGIKLQLDELTGLKKKTSFEVDMKHFFANAIDFEAYIFMIKIDGLSSLVKEFGNDSIDYFIKDFAQVLIKVSETSETSKISAYRFFGSEFVLLITQTQLAEIEKIAQFLSISFTEVGEKYQKTDIAHIGVVPFNPVNTTAGILLAANEAYEQARLIGVNRYYMRTGEDRAKDIAEWKAFVFKVIDNQAYKTLFVGQVESFDSGAILMEEAFTQVLDEKGELVSIGTFVSIAEKFSKIIDLDKSVILNTIDYIKNEKFSHLIAINLSTRTIKNSSFRSWLFDLIKQNKSISDQLVFNLSAYAVSKEILVYKDFIDFVHKMNAKVIIKRFETQSMSSETLKELKPDFIRLARVIGKDISIEPEKKVFVETIQAICELLDIIILAENIQSDEDIACLKHIGIVGGSR